MGCCVENDLFQELTLEEIEEYNKLNSDINQILSNKRNINLQNNEVLLKLINKISIKIANCEEIIEKIKLKRFNSKIFGDTYQILMNNINNLNRYSKFLNEKIIKNRREILEKESTLLKGSGSKTFISFNDSELKSSKNTFSNNFVYQKKFIRRSTKSDSS
jgi:4-diphosphocytidyl-2C-methyl-D-erythritol kinase